MRWLRFSVLTVFLAVLQASAILNLLSVTNLHITPNLLLILLVYLAINCNSYDAIITSFALGFAADLVSPTIGPYFLSFGILGSALAHIRKVILLNKTQHQAGAIFLTGIATGAVARFFAGFTGDAESLGSLTIIIVTAMYSAIIYFLIKWFLALTVRWLGVGVHRFGDKPNM